MTWDLSEKILQRIRIDESGCWVWQASKVNNGYGQITHQRTNHLAHRAAYEICIGPIPDGQQLDHLCRNRACCNPRHLEVVTGVTNVRRGNSLRQHCVNGHAYADHGGTKNSTNTLTDGTSKTYITRFCQTCRNISERNSYALGKRNPA